jgi:hypothetical protein
VSLPLHTTTCALPPHHHNLCPSTAPPQPVLFHRTTTACALPPHHHSLCSSTAPPQPVLIPHHHSLCSYRTTTACALPPHHQQPMLSHPRLAGTRRATPTHTTPPAPQRARRGRSCVRTPSCSAVWWDVASHGVSTTSSTTAPPSTRRPPDPRPPQAPASPPPSTSVPHPPAAPSVRRGSPPDCRGADAAVCGGAPPTFASLHRSTSRSPSLGRTNLSSTAAGKTVRTSGTPAAARTHGHKRSGIARLIPSLTRMCT